MRAEREEDLMIHEYPYTDFHEMNLDWIIREMKKLVDDWASFATDVTASAHEAAQPEVTVSGDLKTGIDFDFGLVKGDQGPEGPIGPQGKGLEILGVYATLADLQSAHPTGTPGDVYLVGSGGSYNIYVWDEDTSDWVDGGPITSPAPAVSNPLMDGTAAVGSSQNYAREDHVHPSDTSKQDALVSGTNIKTLNSNSLLGSGDLTVQETLVSGTNIKTINSNSLLGSGDLTVQETLVSGTNIKTINSESLLGSTDITVQVPLVSGTNIKTVNSNSLLGSGDITVQPTLVSGTNIKTINSNSLLGSGDITIAPGSFTIDLLWTNANPSASFAPQTILNGMMDDYDWFIIAFKGTSTSPNPSYSFQLLNKNGERSRLVSAWDTIITRVITSVSNSGIVFEAGKNTNPYGTLSADTNTFLIPMWVWGLK